MQKDLSAIGQWCLLLVWLGIIASCVRDDDWDMRASGQDTTSHPEIQTASTAEIQQFLKENRLLNPANGNSYSAVSGRREAAEHNFIMVSI